MIKIPLLIIIVLLSVGCSQSIYMQGRKLADEGQYDQAVEMYYDEIRVNPDNADAWRELGVAFYKKGNLDKAEDALKQANHIKPHARTNLYRGMIHERRDEFDLAIGAYSGALNLQTDGQTKDMIRAYLDRLIEKKFKAEAARVVANEAEINANEIPSNTIAVVDFDASQLSPDLAPIALGLAEFTSADLTKVSSLKVVDRMKIDAILSELKLSESGHVDPASAPRVGRIIGSRQLVTGSLLDAGSGEVRLDGVIVNTTDSSTEITEPTEGDMKRFFRIQKEFVFKVIDEMGVELTPDERDSILQIPTESYLAFMAYCRGLDFKRRGNMSAAADAFGMATTEDPGFDQAAEQSETVTLALSAPGGLGGMSPDGFEKSVDEQTGEEPGSGLDRQMTSLINKSGIIPNGDLHRDPDIPPIVTRAGQVLIRGSFDD